MYGSVQLESSLEALKIIYAEPKPDETTLRKLYSERYTGFERVVNELLDYHQATSN